MKLAKLELSGFKSFADYTEFTFDDGITGIVGPNGCGKSNVVDAVKWVLGEMSAKSLRGDAMLDVIFNGSGGRKPMGMSEVSLTFTNEDRRLPIDAETVKITRRLYRDLTSEYLINGQMSRLKDIRELFLDTGIGVDAYSLIEQGRVIGLVDANSMDRREIFEEAAGISRFKQRKKETLRKLEKTDLNLAQSQLVIEEVEKQLRSVKVQAGRARSYQEYAARLKELRSAYVMQEYEGLYRKQVALNEKLDVVIDELGLVRRTLEEKKNRQQELQLELEAANESARKFEREMLSAKAERQNAEQKINFAEQQTSQLTEQCELLTQRQADLAERLALRQAEVTQHEAAQQAIEDALKAQEAQVAEASSKQEQAAKQIATMNRTIDEQKSRAIDLMRQMARFNNDINSLQINQENLTHQREKLEVRKAQVDTQLGELKIRVKALEEQKETLTAQSTELKQQTDDIRAEQQATSQKQAQISHELARQREQRSGLLSRRNVLQDLMAKREGVSQTVRELLKQRDAGQGFGYVRAIVSDILSADLADAPLIEAALGELQNAVIISEAQALLNDAPVWQKLAGRVGVLALDRLPAFQDGYDWALSGKTIRRAVDLVHYDPAHAALVYHLLGKTILVENLADALELSLTGPRGYRFVTQAGEVLESANAGGIMQLGDLSKRTGIISRRAEVASLEEQLANLEVVITDLNHQIAQCDQHGRTLDGRLQELRQQLYQTDNAKAEASAQLQQTAGQLQRTSSEAPLIASEIESIDRQVEQARERQFECTQRVAELEVQSTEVEAVVHDLGSKVILRQHEVAELSEAATKARVAMGQVQEQRAGLLRALAAARQGVSQTEMEIQRIDGELQTAEGRLADAHETIAATQTLLGEMEERAAHAEAQLTHQTEQINVLRGEHSQNAKEVDEFQTRGEGLARQEHEFSLAKNELSIRIETLIEHTQDELGINLVENLTNYQAQSMDWDAVAAEINELKGKISRLGNVNIDAINEQSSLEERQQFLTAQLADIVEAKRQLEELITKINDDSRVRFAETFEVIKAEFQDMFRKLFGGGKADLVMENPDDILESGIEILAKPPGKELQSMSLLSGGEKTMTAVALIMSVFKSKPSPFCILDEVDAALDEANTSRFASIIEEFLNFSQFIVITHNKRTMSVANMLYGVTMQEQGVSKRVAVKFDQKGGTPVVGGTKPEEKSAAA